MKKFPKVLHVTWEPPSGRDADPWLMARPGGVFEVDEPMPIAVYRLVEVGRVEIKKRIVVKEKKSAPNVRSIDARHRA